MPNKPSLKNLFTKKERIALLLVNPKARNGKTDVAAIREVLHRKNNITCIVPPPSKKLSETIIRYASNKKQKLDMVIIGGGDGTLNHAAKGLMATGLPLGIIPLGTANDLARTLGIPLDPLMAAKRIGRDKLHAIDLGEVNGHPFFNVASIGLGAELAGALSPTLKKRWGVIGYIIGTWQVASRTRPVRVAMVWDDGSATTHTFQLAVGNGASYGGGLKVDPTARPDDGLLHVFSLETKNWLGLIPMAPFLKLGWQNAFRSVRSFKTKQLTVHTARPRPINLDGELATHTPATFKVLRRAIHVYTPRQSLKK